MGVSRHRGTVGQGRIRFPARPGMDGLLAVGTGAEIGIGPFRIVVDQGGAESGPLGPGHPFEECGQTPELVLTPRFVGVVVALGTVQAPSQEDPELLGHGVLGPGDDTVLQEMARGAVVALGRDPFPGHLVEGFVGGHRIPDPLPVDVAVLGHSGGDVTDSEQVGQPEGPIVGELQRLQEDAHQFLPLVRVPAGQKLPNPMGRGQGPGQVEADAPEKLGVAGALRRLQMEFAQFGQDMIVDVVAGQKSRRVRHHVGDDADPGAHHVTRGPHQDGGFTRILGPNRSFGVHLHGLQVGGLIAHLTGHVLAGTVRQMGQHHQPVAISRFQDHLGREDLQPPDLPRRLGRCVAVAGPSANPVQQEPVVRRVPAEAFAPSVGDLHRGFPQQEAPVRSVQVHPGLDRVGRFRAHDLVDAALDDPPEVVARVQGVDGQLEPGSALDPTMAVAGVASPLGENGSDVAGKAEGRFRFGRRDPDGGPRRQLAHPDLESRLSDSDGSDPARRVHFGDSTAGQGKYAPGGDVSLESVASFRQYQETLRRAGGWEDRLVREKTQTMNGRRSGGRGGRAQQGERKNPGERNTSQPR